MGVIRHNGVQCEKRDGKLSLKLENGQAKATRGWCRNVDEFTSRRHFDVTRDLYLVVKLQIIQRTTRPMLADIDPRSRAVFRGNRILRWPFLGVGRRNLPTHTGWR